MRVAEAGDIAPGGTLVASVMLAAEEPAAFAAVTVSVPEAGIAAGAV
jgi:hypothetical protein